MKALREIHRVRDNPALVEERRDTAIVPWLLKMILHSYWAFYANVSE